MSPSRQKRPVLQPAGSVDQSASQLTGPHQRCLRGQTGGRVAEPLLLQQGGAAWLPACSQKENVLQNSQNQRSVLLSSNRLLLSCRGRLLFPIVDFKDDLAYVAAGENVTYPCPNEGQDYT